MLFSLFLEHVIQFYQILVILIFYLLLKIYLTKLKLVVLVFFLVHSIIKLMVLLFIFFFSLNTIRPSFYLRGILDHFFKNFISYFESFFM